MKSIDPSKLIDKQIADLTDWRGKMLAKLRKIIHDADPELTEDWKWGTAVWSHKGLVLAVGAFKETVKMNFFQGASLPDPNKLFNAGLEREVDIDGNAGQDYDGADKLVLK